MEAQEVKKKSPMQLSLDYLNKSGYTCQIVEKRLPIPGTYVTQDCFGIADILAYGQGEIVLIQTTSESNFSARRWKIVTSPHRVGWKRNGGKIRLHAWGDRGVREEEL